MGVLFTILGCALLLASFKVKGFFVSDPDAIASFARPRSKWSGQLIFVVVGIGMLAFGIKLLLS